MSFKSHYRAYQEFLTLLKKFQNHCDFVLVNSDVNALQPEFESLKQWFQAHLIPLSAEDLEPAIAPRWQSMQTEIKREFRLLTTDVIFLASSRQTATQEKRLKSVSDRLKKLIDYSQAILNCYEHITSANRHLDT